MVSAPVPRPARCWCWCWPSVVCILLALVTGSCGEGAANISCSLYSEDGIFYPRLDRILQKPDSYILWSSSEFTTLPLFDSSRKSLVVPTNRTLALFAGSFFSVFTAVPLRLWETGPDGVDVVPAYVDVRDDAELVLVGFTMSWTAVPSSDRPNITGDYTTAGQQLPVLVPLLDKLRMYAQVAPTGRLQLLRMTIENVSCGDLDLLYAALDILRNSYSSVPLSGGVKPEMRYVYPYLFVKYAKVGTIWLEDLSISCAAAANLSPEACPPAPPAEFTISNQDELLSALATVEATEVPTCVTQRTILRLVENVRIDTSSWPRETGGIFITSNVTFEGAYSQDGQKLIMDFGGGLQLFKIRAGAFVQINNLIIANLPFSPVGCYVVPIWSFQFIRTQALVDEGRVHLINTTGVVPTDEFVHLQYWTTILTNPTQAIAALAAWQRLIQRMELVGTSADMLRFDRLCGMGITGRNVIITSRNYDVKLVVPETGVSQLLGTDFRLGPPYMIAIYNAPNLARVLSTPEATLTRMAEQDGLTNGNGTRMLLLLQNNITLDRAAWPNASVTLRRTFVVQGKPFGDVTLDFGAGTNYVTLAGGGSVSFKYLTLRGAGWAAEYNASTALQQLSPAAYLQSGLWPVTHERSGAARVFMSGVKLLVSRPEFDILMACRDVGTSNGTAGAGLPPSLSPAACDKLLPKDAQVTNVSRAGGTLTVTSMHVDAFDTDGLQLAVDPNVSRSDLLQLLAGAYPITASPPPGGGGGPSTGAIVGGAVGGAIGCVAAVVLLSLFLVRRSRSREREKQLRNLQEKQAHQLEELAGTNPLAQMILDHLAGRDPGVARLVISSAATGGGGGDGASAADDEKYGGGGGGGGSGGVHGGSGAAGSSVGAGCDGRGSGGRGNGQVVCTASATTSAASAGGGGGSGSKAASASAGTGGDSGGQAAAAGSAGASEAAAAAGETSKPAGGSVAALRNAPVNISAADLAELFKHLTILGAPPTTAAGGGGEGLPHGSGRSPRPRGFHAAGGSGGASGAPPLPPPSSRDSARFNLSALTNAMLARMQRRGGAGGAAASSGSGSGSGSGSASAHAARQSGGASACTAGADKAGGGGGGVSTRSGGKEPARTGSGKGKGAGSAAAAMDSDGDRDRDSAGGGGGGGGGHGAGGGAAAAKDKARAGDSGEAAVEAAAAAAPSLPEGLQEHVSQSPVLEELLRLSVDLAGEIDDNQLMVTDVVASGGFGTVYKGMWHNLPVAVKIVLFSTASVNRRVALQEAALSKSICHPNVISTYAVDAKPMTVLGRAGSAAVGSGGGDSKTKSLADIQEWRLYIIQEYADGGTLRRALDKGAFHEPFSGFPYMDMLLDIAQGVATALAHLHSKNVVHGDLNPKNVLLKVLPGLARGAAPKASWLGGIAGYVGKQPPLQYLSPAGQTAAAAAAAAASGTQLSAYPLVGRCGFAIKVADFGLSVKLADTSHISGLRQGTPFYASPELSQQGIFSRAADVYAFGVILWELYWGRPIWVPDPTAPGGYVQHVNFPLLPPDCPPEYASLVADCLQLNHLQRPCFDEVLGRLRAVANAAAREAAAAAAAAAAASPASGGASSASRAAIYDALSPMMQPGLPATLQLHLHPQAQAQVQVQVQAQAQAQALAAAARAQAVGAVRNAPRGIGGFGGGGGAGTAAAVGAVQGGVYRSPGGGETHSGIAGGAQRSPMMAHAPAAAALSAEQMRRAAVAAAAASATSTPSPLGGGAAASSRAASGAAALLRTAASPVAANIAVVGAGAGAVAEKSEEGDTSLSRASAHSAFRDPGGGGGPSSRQLLAAAAAAGGQSPRRPVFLDDSVEAFGDDGAGAAVVARAGGGAQRGGAQGAPLAARPPAPPAPPAPSAPALRAVNVVSLLEDADVDRVQMLLATGSPLGGGDDAPPALAPAAGSPAASGAAAGAADPGSAAAGGGGGGGGGGASPGQGQGSRLAAYASGLAAIEEEAADEDLVER